MSYELESGKYFYRRFARSFAMMDLGFIVEMWSLTADG